MATTLAARWPVGFGTSLRQQISLLGSSLRWAYVIGAVLFIGAVVITIGELPRHIPIVMVLAMLLWGVAVVWTIMTWANEQPSRRDYHWSLPISRPAHDMARVLTGACYLVVICVAVALACGLYAALNGEFARFAQIRAEAWANYFIAPLILYMLTMPVVLWSEYRITRIGVAGVLLLPFVLLMMQRSKFPGSNTLLDGMEAMVASDWGLSVALMTGIQRELLAAAPSGFGMPEEPWWPAALVWLTLGTVMTILAATWRPADVARKRHAP